MNLLIAWIKDSVFAPLTTLFFKASGEDIYNRNDDGFQNFL